MGKVVEVFGLLCLGYALVRSQERSRSLYSLPSDCEVCQPQSCNIPKNCEAGMVKDRCGCCMVCAKTEFQLCDHPQVEHSDDFYLGKCGENLECRLRHDLDEGEKPEALCYCTLQGTLCGTDGVTYENLCQLMAAGVKTDTRITVESKGPCKAAPEIMSPPINTKDVADSNIAIVCEAKGFPIPTIEWTWTRVDGKTEFLPSDDLRMSVNMRGGPEKWQITGWLQIMKVQKEHEGDYTCIAQNELGVAQATARINVIEDQEAQDKKKRRHHRDRKNRLAYKDENMEEIEKA